jgi:hypothetical protein
MMTVTTTTATLTGPTGSLISNLYLSGQGPTPEVGMGATIAHWTDRTAATIVEIVRFKTGKRAGQIKALIVQADHAARTDSNGMSDAQSYEYSRNPDAPRVTCTVTKHGQFKHGSDRLIVGIRDEHYDFSF